jgi:hypothetical protein
MNTVSTQLEDLRNSEKTIRKIFREELKAYSEFDDNCINLLLDSTSLFGDLCRDTKIEPTEEQFYSQISIAALGSSVVNQLEAFNVCLTNGLLQPGIAISRTAFETVSLAHYLALYPSEAVKWVEGRKIEMSTVRNGLPDTQEYRMLYKMMSGISHPNFDSVQHLIHINKETHELSILLGNTVDPLRIQIAANMFLHCCRYSVSTFIENVFRFPPHGQNSVGLFGRLKKYDAVYQRLLNRYK